MSSSSSSSSMLSSSKMSSTSEMSSKSPSMTANVNQYVETTTSKDTKVTIPPAALSFSSSSSFTQTAPSSMSSTNSSSSSTLTSSTMPEEIEYTESSKNDNTVKIPPVAIDSSLSNKVLKTNSDLPESKIIASEKINTNIETSKPSSAHTVTATLKNQESYVMQESTQKIEEIKKTEQEKINKIQLETSEKLRVVEQKQRETQSYLKEAEMCKSLLITKEQQLNKMCDQEKLMIDELENKKRELALKQSEIESFRTEVIDIKRRASAAQAKAELCAKEAPAIIESTTVEKKKVESSSDSSSDSSAPSKLASIGSSIKSMFGMGSSNNAESTSEEGQTTKTTTTTVKQQKYTQSA